MSRFTVASFSPGNNRPAGAIPDGPWLIRSLLPTFRFASDRSPMVLRDGILLRPRTRWYFSQVSNPPVGPFTNCRTLFLVPSARRQRFTPTQRPAEQLFFFLTGVVKGPETSRRLPELMISKPWRKLYPYSALHSPNGLRRATPGTPFLDNPEYPRTRNFVVSMKILIAEVPATYPFEETSLEYPRNRHNREFHG